MKKRSDQKNKKKEKKEKREKGGRKCSPEESAQRLAGNGKPLSGRASLRTAWAHCPARRERVLSTGMVEWSMAKQGAVEGALPWTAQGHREHCRWAGGQGLVGLSREKGYPQFPAGMGTLLRSILCCLAYLLCLVCCCWLPLLLSAGTSIHLSSPRPITSRSLVLFCPDPIHPIQQFNQLIARCLQPS